MSVLSQGLDNHTGCIVGLACGDAFGAPVEGLSLDGIKARYGEAGVTRYEIRRSWRGGRAFKPGTYTDDTQMALATAVALIEAANANENPITYLYSCYMEWLEQQGKDCHRRGPGKTCINSLLEGAIGTPANPANKSKGCGGVMRVAPVGLIYPPGTAFYLGCVTAALTHGHKDGFLPAGVLAEIISRILNEEDILSAIESSMKYINFIEDSNLKELIERAVDLSFRDEDIDINSIGYGWTGDEALAMAIYCSLRCIDFKSALIKAVNHSGDSDSVGSICGAIFGVRKGISHIPDEFKTVENYSYLLEIGSKTQYLRGLNITNNRDFKYLFAVR